jgi:SecD/SecF fusion protein
MGSLRTVTGVLLMLLAITCRAREPAGMVLTYEVDGCGGPALKQSQLKDIIETVNKCLGNAGKAKAAGKDKLEIEIYGALDADAVTKIKSRIGSGGCLEFRIVADLSNRADKAIVEAAKKLPVKEKDVLLGGKKVAQWVRYLEREFGPADEEHGGIVKRAAGNVPEALVLVDEFNVTGRYLVHAKKGDDTTGHPAIHFKLNEEGGKRFEQLTKRNLPDPANPTVYRSLGVILDKQLLSAPQIRSTISAEGMISGGSLTEREIEDTIRILNAGSFPYALRLISEARVGEQK